MVVEGEEQRKIIQGIQLHERGIDLVSVEVEKDVGAIIHKKLNTSAADQVNGVQRQGQIPEAVQIVRGLTCSLP